jgi:hypothetical protein
MFSSARRLGCSYGVKSATPRITRITVGVAEPRIYMRCNGAVLIVNFPSLMERDRFIESTTITVERDVESDIAHPTHDKCTKEPDDVYARMYKDYLEGKYRTRE